MGVYKEPVPLYPLKPKGPAEVKIAETWGNFNRRILSRKFKRVTAKHRKEAFNL